MNRPTILKPIFLLVASVLGVIIDNYTVKVIALSAIVFIIILIYIDSKNMYNDYSAIDDAIKFRDETTEQAENLKQEALSDYNDKIKAAESKMNETNSMIEQLRSKSQQEIKELAAKEEKRIKEMLDAANERLKVLSDDYNELNGKYTYELTSFDISDDITSEEYKSKYTMCIQREKELVTKAKALSTSEEGLSNITSKEKLKVQKQIDIDAKQLLRCFNSETASIISAVTVKNIDSSKNKIIRTFETLNKLFVSDKVSLTQALLELKLEQADLMYAYQYQKEQEKLQQKAIREQMVEEEKVRREIEKEKAKIEKEENQFKNEIAKLIKYMQKASEVEKQLYIDKIHELEDKLKKIEADKENVLEREQNTRAGYVYVISNIGSFGEDVYKIGMTRRLEPMDRVKELGDASVPFEFDVHAMIFSEDAPALESILHNTFKDKQVNKVNPRKEFFKVSLDDVEKVVKDKYNSTVTFTKIAEAAQYRESLRLAEESTVTV